MTPSTRRLIWAIAHKFWPIVLPALLLCLGALPVTAQSAEPAIVDVTLPVYSGQSFESVVAEASAMAQESVSQAFADPAVTEVLVNVLSSRNGNVLPLIVVRVSREDWQSSPSIEQWARYQGGAARQLLGYAGPQTASTAAARQFVPVSTDSRADYVIPGASLEESDPGYR